MNLETEFKKSIIRESDPFVVTQFERTVQHDVFDDS